MGKGSPAEGDLDVEGNKEKGPVQLSGISRRKAIRIQKREGRSNDVVKFCRRHSLQSTAARANHGEQSGR